MMEWFGIEMEDEGGESGRKEEERKMETTAEDQLQTEEYFKYSSLYFWFQALRVAGQLQPSAASADQT